MLVEFRTLFTDLLCYLPHIFYFIGKTIFNFFFKHTKEHFFQKLYINIIILLTLSNYLDILSSLLSFPFISYNVILFDFCILLCIMTSKTNLERFILSWGLNTLYVLTFNFTLKIVWKNKYKISYKQLN